MARLSTCFYDAYCSLRRRVSTVKICVYLCPSVAKIWSWRTFPPRKFKNGHVWSFLVTSGHFWLVQRDLSLLVPVRKDLGGFDSGSVSICVYLCLSVVICG